MLKKVLIGLGIVNLFIFLVLNIVMLVLAIVVTKPRKDKVVIKTRGWDILILELPPPKESAA